jgi:ELWxxDGT repeat protein
MGYDGWGCKCTAQTYIENGNIGVIYGHAQDVGYQRVLDSENIKSGKGYWILLNNTSDQTRLRICCATMMLKDINPSGSSYPSELTEMNNKLYFTADDGEYGAELWSSDGTAAGTMMIMDINPDGSSDPDWLTDLNGILFFSACENNSGCELWKYIP